MKLHTPAPYESRMCLNDLEVKGLGLLGIENSQGCSMLIQRVFATRIFASLMQPLLVNNIIIFVTGNDRKTRTDIDTAIAIAKHLIQYGVDVNALDVFVKSPLLEMLMKMRPCSSSLGEEDLWRKQTALSEMLIAAGAKATYYMKTQDIILNVAVSLENANLVKLLLKAGADVNEDDRYNYTPLRTCLEQMSKFFFKHNGTQEDFYGDCA